MWFRTFLPKLPAGLGIERVKPTDLVAEQQHVCGSGRDGEDRGANRSRCLKDPFDAAGVQGEGLHQTAGATDEDLAIEDCGLRKRHCVSLEAVGPFELE